MAPADANYKGSGIYRHYKGDDYYIYGLIVKEEEKPDGLSRAEQIAWVNDPANHWVAYAPLSPGSLLFESEVMMWSRRLRVFNENIYDGQAFFPRFVKVKSDG